MAPDLGPRQVFHLLVVAYYMRFDKFVFTVLVHDITAIGDFNDKLVFMVPQFATVWAQFVFQDYFLLSFLEDLLEWTPKTFWRPFKDLLSDHANNLFTTYGLPFTIVMCVNFWVVYFLDPRMIDEHHVLFDVLDRTTNHLVHTHVIPILLVEMCITRRHYPPSVTVAYPYVKITLCFAAYFAIVFGMKMFTPVWSYPFFETMTVSQWVPYILANLILVYVCYAFGFILNELVWGKRGAASVQCSSSREGGWEGRSMGRKLLRMIQVIEST